MAEQAAFEHFKNGASSKCFGVLPAKTQAKVPVAASFFHVLTFMVVGRKEAVNVQATCDVLSGVANVSFFYAHYDDAQPWYAKQAWYRRCARDHVAYREKVKSRFVVNAIASRGSAWAETYSHVWIIDEDVRLPPLRYVRHFLRESHCHGALISQPAIYGSVWSLLRPHPRCATRATDLVELMLPLLQTRVALDVFTRLYRSEATTDWGLDITWCKYTASRFRESPACIVVNAGRFVHPTGNTTANYSRRSGQEDFLCMRAMHAALVSEPKNLACLREDRYNSLDPVLTDATLAPAPAAHHAPAAIEASRHRPLKMYVYRLKRFGSKGHCISLHGGGAHDFEWELHVESNLRATFAVTADPSQADFFLLPACLNRLWASGWRWSEARQKLRACVECTSRFERKLLHVMRAVGPWYDEHPEKHLVTRHRCPYIGEQSWAINAGEEVYTELWRHPRLRYICLETDPEPPPGAVRDWHREVHVPYFVDAATMQSPLPHAKRAHDFGFAGSLCCGRGWLTELLRLDERVELRDHTGSAANATRLLRTASFAVEPRGDMPERRIIYEALHAGTPLVFTSPVAPPLRLLSWDGVAIEAGASLWHGAEPLPTLRSHDVQRALAHYDKWMASFEAARETFIWGTPAFRRRLELVVADVITQ